MKMQSSALRKGMEMPQAPPCARAWRCHKLRLAQAHEDATSSTLRKGMEMPQAPPCARAWRCRRLRLAQNKQDKT
ncbi:MAG: hypothetical protein J6X49_00145 [Victivallales bacterium]|nr:hypothetical protein [Victivallales bacterium]